MPSGNEDDGINQKLGKCTCNLCSVLGFDIAIHYSFPLYVVALLVIAIAIEKKFESFIFYVLYVVILFGSVLIHEMSEAGMAKLIGAKVNKILLWPFGGFAYCAHSTEAIKQLAISVTGPLIHVPLIFIFWGIWTAMQNGSCDNIWKRGDVHNCFGQNLFLEGFRIQVLLCLFNLFIPLYPFDGGVIFLTILMYYCNLSAEMTGKISLVLSTLILVTMLGLAFWSMDYLSILVCTYLGFQVFQLYRAIKGGKINEHPLFQYTSKLWAAGELKADVPLANVSDLNAQIETNANSQPVGYAQQSWGNEPATNEAKPTTNNDSWGGNDGWDAGGAYENNAYG